MKLTLLILFAILSLSAGAQNPVIYDGPESKLPLKEQESLWRQRKEYKVNKMGVTVHVPPGFTEISSFYFRPPDNSSSSSYTFVNSDSTAFIVIALLQKDSAGYARDEFASKLSSRLIRFSINGSTGYFSEYDPRFQWYANFSARLDSAIIKPYFYNPQELKRFNAEQGVVFKKMYKELYLGKYEIVRNITLNRKHRGIVEIQYFAKPGGKAELEEIIEGAPEMVSYW